MIRRFSLPLLLACLTLFACQTGQAADLDPVAADETMLKAASLPTDGAGLLEFFRQRTRGEAQPERLAELIKGLSAAKPTDREKAAGELVAAGPIAIPLLRQVVKDPDAAETAALARRCLESLEGNSVPLAASAIRVLAQRNPAGTLEALLAYLPASEDETVMDEVHTALASLAYKAGKAEPILLKALEDANALRRAAAIDALCQNGIAEPRATLRKLLLDPSPVVRLRSALALSHANDPKAVSTLIALLADLPPALSRQAEDFLTSLAGEQSPKTALGTDELSRQKCRDAWAAWWLATEGDGPLTELRKRTLTDADREKGQTLIVKLGDDKFDVRQKAEADLKALGAAMLPLLRQAINHPDVEVRQRVQNCLEILEKDKGTPLSVVTLRVLALRKPAGATEALLAYAPMAEDESTLAELQNALNAVALSDPKAAEVLVKALADKIPSRRAAAAEALCQGALSGEHLPALRKLLKDEDLSVRLRAALVLAGVREKEAVPVLISLVRELPASQAATAEEYLLRLAAGHPPASLPEGEGKPERTTRSEKWAAWWTENADRVELVDRRAPANVERFLGFILHVSQNGRSVTELDRAGKVRWTIAGLANPTDAQALPGDRVLITEGQGNLVSERTTKGDIIWKKQVPFFPMNVQRLPNGHTFITGNNALLELDRSGKEVFTLQRQNEYIFTGRKLRNGEIVLVNNAARVSRIDSTGKEIKGFTLPNGNVGNFNEVLPNGNVLVSMQWMNKVVEFDADGKTVWEANVTQPMAVSRLPNGNTLVSLQQWPTKVVELDRTGKQVAETPSNVYVYRIHSR
jgi:HEAT repeat protein